MDYSQFPKEFTCRSIWCGWKIFKKWWWLGLKIDEPRITAYLYKGKWYVTRLV